MPARCVIPTSRASDGHDFLRNDQLDPCSSPPYSTVVIDPCSARPPARATHERRPGASAQPAGGCRRRRRVARALRRARSDVARGARAAQPWRGAGRPGAAGRGRIRPRQRRGRRDRAPVPCGARAGHRVRRRHIAGGARGGTAGRRVRRLHPDEPRARGQRRRHGLPGAGRRHARAAQRRAQGHGPVLPDRSGCQCDDRRHDRDARVRHQRRALRHDARKRDGSDRGDRRGRAGAHRRARAQIERRLRPDAPLRRQRGHARRHHRNPAAPVRPARVDHRRRLPVSRPRQRDAHRDRGDADEHSGGAHRAPRRCADGCLHPLLEAHRLCRASRRCSSSSMARVPAPPSRRN